MALNPFFLQGSPSEQRLVQDLINEQLKIYGVEVTYIPRKFVRKQTIIEEIQSSKFDDNFLIEAYVNNFDGYTGVGDILTKFGMSLRDELSLVISQERFEDFISPFLDAMDDDEVEISSRPREGDLIYFPLGQRIFEVKFVEHEQPFYQLGKNYVYELKCELFEYGDEVVDTSINEIDQTVSNQGEILSLKLVSFGQPAIASPLINSGYVREIFINNDGYGYTSTPTVSFTPAPTGGQTASAVAITTTVGGVRSVKDIVLTRAGFGYTVAPKITLSGGGGTGFAATCSIQRFQNGVVQIQLQSGGQGYTNIPEVSISPPTFLNPSAISFISNGVVNSISMTNGGSSFSPKANISVSFSPPNPSGLQTSTGEALIKDDKLNLISISNPGFGYSVAPNVIVSEPTGIASTATAICTILNDEVSSISIASSGRYYITNPSVEIDPPSGEPLTAQGSSSLVVGEISTITALLSYGGRYYLNSPNYNVSYLQLSEGFTFDSKFGNYSWRLINSVPNREVNYLSNGNVSIGSSGFIQFWTKVPSNIVGINTCISLNISSLGPSSEDINFGITEDGYPFVGVGTIRIDGITDLRDDLWHYVSIVSVDNPSQTIKLFVDGLEENEYNFSAIGFIDLITNADTNPPILLNTSNSMIQFDDIYGSNVDDSGSSNIPFDTPIPNQYAVIFDNFEDGIGTEQTFSFSSEIFNGSVVNIIPSEINISGIITSITTQTFDPPDGSPVDFRSLASAEISNGVVSAINIDYPGIGYIDVPNIIISEPTGTSSNFRAIATASISGFGTITKFDVIEPGLGYEEIPTISVSEPLGRTAVGRSIVGVAGTITSISIIDGGVGYTQPPIISIASTITDRDFTAGFSTARAVAIVNDATNQVIEIRIIDPGAGYQSNPVITISNPPIFSGIGTYWFNEVVVGSISGTKARVRRWDKDTNIMQIAHEDGEFIPGELLVGAASSSVYSIDTYISKLNVPKDSSLVDIDKYEQNDIIEIEANQIIDFSESNLFGNY
jgi:hypothetical protein